MLHSFQSVKVYKVMAYLPLQPSRDIQIISWSFQRTEMRNETVEILCDLIYLNSCFLTPSQLQAIFLPHHQVWSRFPIINRTQTPLALVPDRAQTRALGYCHRFILCKTTGENTIFCKMTTDGSVFK